MDFVKFDINKFLEEKYKKENVNVVNPPVIVEATFTPDPKNPKSGQITVKRRHTVEDDVSGVMIYLSRGFSIDADATNNLNNATGRAVYYKIVSTTITVVDGKEISSNDVVHPVGATSNQGVTITKPA